MDSCVADLNFINLGLQRRKDLLEKKDFLKLDELFVSQGKIFGKILLDQMSPIAKTLLKADKNHTMLNENIFVAPVDRVLQIVIPDRLPCRVNATGTELLKATTFEYILQEGIKIEEKMVEKQNQKLMKQIQQSSDFERYQADERLNYALREQEEIFNQKLERFRQKVQTKFQEKTDKLEKFYDKKYNKMMKEIVEESDERLEFLRLKMQRENDCLLSKIEELKKKIVSMPIIETADKETNVDFVSADIRKFEEQRFKDKYINDTEKLASVLSFVGALRNEQDSKFEQMKQDYFKTLTTLKDILDSIMKCICTCKGVKKSMDLHKCSTMIRTFLEVHKVTRNAYDEYEKAYHKKFCEFIKKPLCTFVIPANISKQFICECQSSSSDTEECSCENKVFPGMLTSGTTLTKSVTHLRRCQLECISSKDIYKKNMFDESHQKLLNIIDMPSIVKNICETILNESIKCNEIITEVQIENRFLELIKDHINSAVSVFDFTWLKNCIQITKKVNVETECVQENKKLYSEKFDDLHSEKHYFFDFLNRKRLPKYLIDGHGNKTYIYKELTKDELIEIYKKDKI